MHKNEMFYDLICINNHVLSCLVSMLSSINTLGSGEEIRNRGEAIDGPWMYCFEAKVG